MEVAKQTERLTDLQLSPIDNKCLQAYIYFDEQSTKHNPAPRPFCPFTGL